MKVVTINTNGLRSSSKRAAFLLWITSLGCDIVFLQETHCKDQNELNSWFSSSIFQAIGAFHSPISRGVAILLRRSLTFQILDQSSLDQGRCLSLKVNFSDHIIRLCCIYAPNHNPEKETFFRELQGHLDPTEDVLLAGDFNSVLDPLLDRQSASPLHPSYDCSLVIQELLEDFRLIDSWRYHHPGVTAFSFLSNFGLSRSRIDLIALPLRLLPLSKASDIIPCPHSDHAAVIVSFDFPDQQPRGSSSWKLNKSCLTDDVYINQIRTFWTYWRPLKPRFHSLLSWWDIGKRHIKSLTIKFCSAKARDRNETRQRLSSRATSLKTRIDCGDSNLFQQYQDILSELSLLDREEAAAASIRSRADWIEHGEAPSSFFLRLEKQRSASKTIDVIQDSSGRFVSDTQDLLEVWRDFYAQLFSESRTDDFLQDSFLDYLHTSLSPDQRLSCEGPLTSDECLSALRGMASNKAPGLDGLPKEFYLAFWDILGADLVEVLNFALATGTLSYSQRVGVITLIHKKGPRYDCKNWRPVTLLSLDYKIASRAISIRLRRVMATLVSSDQTCAVPGRFIGDNIRLIQDSATYANLLNLPLAILSLDQEKAFDRVNWTFLIRVLQRFGFGPSFISWIHLFYTGPLSTVQVNGFFAAPFSLSRGVRQGCPLSAPLYVLVAETLACRLRGDLSLTGLRLPSFDYPCLISQYADDTTIFCTSDEEIKSTFQVYSDYEQASGAKLNLAKCHGLWCGSWRYRTLSPVSLEWSSDHIKCLGVYIGHGDLERLNWSARIQKFATILTSWKQRSLSLLGKAVVLNALGLSGLWYLATMVHLPDWALQEINRQIFQFFWSGKKELVSRDTLSLPPARGGYGLAHVKLKSFSLKACWIRRYSTSPNSPWIAFFSFFIRHFFGSEPLDVLSSPAFYPPHLLPPFYGELLLAWSFLGGQFTRPSGLCFRSESGALSPVSGSCAKSLYTALVVNTISPPRCVEKFAPIFGPLYWEQTWQQVTITPLDRKVRDLSWKAAHGVLLTADRLARFGMSVDQRCFCTREDETPSHLFFHCTFISSLLLWAQSLIMRAHPSFPSLQERHLLFGFAPAELRHVSPVCLYLINLIKYFVWLARNDFRFNGKQPEVAATKAKIVARLNTHLQIFSKKFRSPAQRRAFHASWNVLGKFSPDIRSIAF